MIGTGLRNILYRKIALAQACAETEIAPRNPQTISPHFQLQEQRIVRDEVQHPPARAPSSGRSAILSLGKRLLLQVIH